MNTMEHQWTNIENVIQFCIDEANRKKDAGLLIPPNHPNYEEIFEEGMDGVEGDAESVYSLISLYADNENNDGTWEGKLEEALEREFPEYF